MQEALAVKALMLAPASLAPSVRMEVVQEKQHARMLG